jgi:hypothetical protein
MPVDLSEYLDVAARIVQFREQFPTGSLQPADPTVPYRIESIGDQTYIVVVAAAYRTPDDPRPGIGMAYEVFPGKSNFTKGSELQNAETSAWGRSIVAALAADTKKGIASAQEVRNRRAEQDQPAASQPEDPQPYHTAIAAASTLPELTAAGALVAGAVLREADRKELREAYTEQMTVLKADQGAA